MQRWHLTFITLLLAISLDAQVQEIELNPDGVVVPRVDHTSIASHVAGQLVYDINTNSFWFHDGSDWNELGGIFEKNGNTVRQSAGYNTDHFLFGSPQMDDDGDINHNPRMFFNKQKRAFRVGSTRDTTFFNLQLSGSSTVWDPNQLGYYSFASGLSNEASGESSFAMGEVNTASGRYSMAMGWGAEATGRASTSIGFQTGAHGFASTALGRGTIANGETSTVLGRWSKEVDMVQAGVADTTRLFIIGNGNDAVNRSNALVVQKNGRVGIGENSPDALLHIQGTGSGLHVDENLPIVFGQDSTGAGVKAFWLPSKAAFRVGGVGNGSIEGLLYFSDEDSWDRNNIGLFSFAAGLATKAEGSFSIAMGRESKAIGLTSTAMGRSTAIGPFSTALGGSTANAHYSTAMGDSTEANGYASTVIGMYNNTLDDVVQNTVFDTTRLFIIGNGSLGNRSNAMVVQKNGRVGIGTNRPQVILHASGGDVIVDRGDTTNALTRFVRIGGARNSSGNSYAELQFSNYDDNSDPVDNIRAKITSTNSNSAGNGDLRFFTYDGSLTERMRIQGAGNVGVDCNPAVKFQVGVNGDGSTAEANAWNLFSDIRYKENVTSIDHANALVQDLMGRKFSWKNSGEADIGFIAQEVEQVLPEIVHTNDQGFKSLDYAKITPLLVEAIKEQQQIIEAQALAIEGQKDRLEIQQLDMNKQSQDIRELKELVYSMLPVKGPDQSTTTVRPEVEKGKD